MSGPNFSTVSGRGSERLFREGADSMPRSTAKEALLQFRQTLRVSQRRGDQKKTAWSLVQMAMVMRGLRQYPNALHLLEEAREIFSMMKYDLGLATVFNEIAFVQRELQHNTVALECAHHAIRLFQEMGRTIELGWAYDNMAVIQMNLCHRNESLAFGKRARAIFLEFNMQNGFAWNACNLGLLHLDMGLISEGEQYFTEALETFTVVKNQQGCAWAHFGLMATNRALCRFEKAEDHLKKAKAIFEEMDLKDRVGWCLLNEAAIRRATGDGEEAMALNKRALQLFGPLKNNDGVGWSLFQIGQQQRDRGLLVKAWQTQREAINLHSDIGNRKGIGWAESELGKTYLELGDLAHARECFIKAKEMADQLDDAPLKIETIRNLANMNLDEGLLQKASELLTEAETQAQKIQGHEAHAEILLERVRYYLLMQEIPKAAETLRIAGEIVTGHGLRRLEPAIGLFRTEILAAQGQMNEALLSAEGVLVHTERFEMKRQHVQALLGLAQLLFGKRSAAQMNSMLAQIEKETRVFSSKKLKAKLMMVKGLAAFEANGKFEGRFFTQAIQVAGAAGLCALQKKFLDTALQLAEKAGRTVEREVYKRELASLLERGPIDLHLIRPPHFGVLPVTIAI